MSLAQTVIMIGIGSLLIQPVAEESIWVTLGAGLLLVLTLIAMEYAQLKFDFMERFISGESKILIEKGELNEKNLRKVRFTVDQLEMNLRQQNVASLDDVEWATLESNGQVGFQLKEEAQVATKKDIALIQQELQQLKDYLLVPSTGQKQTESDDSLFQEVKRKSHGTEPPKRLQ